MSCVKKYRLRKRRVVADLISSAPHRFPCGRRPRQTESRSEILVVRFDFVPHQELRWIESREGRIRQHIGRLPEILIAEPYCQGKAWRQFPIVLDKVGLSQLRGAEYRYAES